MKKSFSLILFLSLLNLSCGLQAEEILVHDNVSLLKAVKEAVAGNTISLEDGVYRDVQLVVHADGGPQRKITVQALHPGKVSFTGDVKVELRGNYNVLRGIYFKDGDRKKAEWKSHGPGLVAVYGDHCEIAECLFYHFDEANSAYITTSLTDEGHVPQYCHIHHCAFIEKTTLDQVINLNNTLKKSVKGEPGIPMYHRVSYCYFSNPPKKGNAGGGIRVGYWRKDYGRCLIDHNLFERQDSEPEIVTSKSMENVYYANTILNCRGTLNLRHGDQQVVLNNIFLGTDKKHDYGALYLWGSRHIIGNNYISLSRTLKNRGSAGIFFNCGPKASEHALAYDILVLGNTFENVNGVVFHFAPLYERRIEVFGEQCELPYNIHFVNNFITSDEMKDKVWSEVGHNASRQLWRNNIYRNFSERAFSDIDGWTEGDGQKVMSREDLANLLPYTHIEGIDLDFIEVLSQPLDVRPLGRHDVGPGWCTQYPGTYFESGVYKSSF